MRVNREIRLDDKDDSQRGLLQPLVLTQMLLQGSFVASGRLTLGRGHEEEIINAIKAEIYGINELWLEIWVAGLSASACKAL